VEIKRLLNAATGTVLFTVLLFLPAASVGGKKYEITRESLQGMAPAMQRQIAGLQYLLNPYQLRQFFSLSGDSLRTRWIETYWKSRDPSPATPKNEMEIEHNIRVKLVRQFFKNKNWPGWDKRGEVFIRYGPPNYRGKIHAEVTVRRLHPPGEIWFYSKHAMLVTFKDHSLTGNYIYAINPLGAAQDVSPDLVEFLLYDTESSLQELIPSNLLEFYRDTETDPDAEIDWTPLHEAISGVQQKKYVRPRMRGVTERWDEIVDPDTPNDSPNNPSLIFQKDKVEELATNFETVLEESPSSYPFNFEQREFPFFFDLAQFRGGESVNRVEVNVEFPVRSGSEDEDPGERTYSATAVVLDAGFNELRRESTELVVPPAASSGGNGRLLPVQLLFSLPKDYYRFTVTVTEKETERESSYRSTLTFREFDSGLAISDVLFARKIAQAEKQSPFNRGALEVVPHPLRSYRKSDAVPVYFELYNLGVGEDGLSSYTVEYKIVPHSPQKTRFWERFRDDAPAVSSRFQSSGYGTTDPLYVQVRTDNLWVGAFDFMVTIKDEITQSITFRKATFRIVE
jgi:GWxTD domain-containing protein